METYNRLTEEQGLRGIEIQEQLNNMRQDTNRPKTREYIKKIETYFNNSWKDFKETHRKIEELDMPTEKYFTQNFHRQVREIYEKAIDYIQSYTLALNFEEDSIHESMEQIHNDDEKLKATQPEKKISDKEQETAHTQKSVKKSDEIREFVLQTEDRPLSTEEQKLRIKKQIVRMNIFRRAMNDVLNTREEKSNTYCQFKIKEISELWNNILQLHEEIMIFATDDDREHMYFQEKEYETLEEIYRKIMIKLHQEIKETTCSLKKEYSQEAYDIKLPRISIPIFDGNYEKYFVTYT